MYYNNRYLRGNFSSRRLSGIPRKSSNTNSFATSFLLSIILIAFFVALIWLLGKILGFDWSIQRFYNWIMGEVDSNKHKNPTTTKHRKRTTSAPREEKEVYNLNPNIFRYEDAKKACRAQKPSAQLASLEQVNNAYNNGAEWCNYGWSKDQLALYPTQLKTFQKDAVDACGYPGINGGYFSNPELRFGVNCYGIKRDPKGDEVEKYYDDDVKIMNEDTGIAYSEARIIPFNKHKWSGVKN